MLAHQFLYGRNVLAGRRLLRAPAIPETPSTAPAIRNSLRPVIMDIRPPMGRGSAYLTTETRSCDGWHALKGVVSHPATPFQGVPPSREEYLSARPRRRLQLWRRWGRFTPEPGWTGSVPARVRRGRPAPPCPGARGWACNLSTGVAIPRPGPGRPGSGPWRFRPGPAPARPAVAPGSARPA